MALEGTGRLKPPDRDKDTEYLLERRPRAASGVVRRTHRSVGILDQGSTSQCVIYACDKYLTTWPIRNKGFKTAEERAKIYREVQEMDEWPGIDPEIQGTSVRAMFKWMKDKGYVSEYRWAFDCETVINHVLGTGPVEMGTIWDDGMSNPDKWGYIAPNQTTADDSGHAWTIIGADRQKKNPDGTNGRVTMVNSWGTGWGLKGRAYVTFDNLDRLIKMDGEAAVATEIKVAGLDLTTLTA